MSEIGIKDQCFGVEVEMTGITRRQAAEALAEYFGTSVHYCGTYYDTWGVTDPEGKEWKLMSDGSIRAERKTAGGYESVGRGEYQVEDMDNLELNAQLKTLAEEKQDILDQIAAHQQDEEQQAIQASRRREMEEWLDQQPMCLTEYDDTLTRRFMERITVVDAETIQVKIRDVDIVIDEEIC